MREARSRTLAGRSLRPVASRSLPAGLGPATAAAAAQREMVSRPAMAAATPPRPAPARDAGARRPLSPAASETRRRQAAPLVGRRRAAAAPPARAAPKAEAAAPFATELLILLRESASLRALPSRGGALLRLPQPLRGAPTFFFTRLPLWIQQQSPSADVHGGRRGRDKRLLRDRPSRAFSRVSVRRARACRMRDACRPWRRRIRHCTAHVRLSLFCCIR